MVWRVETLDKRVDDEIERLPAGLRSRVVKLLELVAKKGPQALRVPHTSHLEGPFWELRAKATEGIARGIYVAVSGRRVVVLHVFVKKTQKTPRRALEIARDRLKKLRQ